MPVARDGGVGKDGGEEGGVVYEDSVVAFLETRHIGD